VHLAVTVGLNLTRSNSSTLSEFGKTNPQGIEPCGFCHVSCDLGYSPSIIILVFTLGRICLLGQLV